MSLDLEAAAAAADALFDARFTVKKLDALPDRIRPITASDGYAVQAAVVEKLLSVGDARRVGYKIGATNAASREMLGAREAFAGVLISSFCHASPVTIKAKDYHVIVLEPEIALRMGKGLPLTGAPYTREMVAEAIEAAAPAIEVISSPFPVWNEAGIGNIIGDNGANGAWIHGKFDTEFRCIDFSKLTVSLMVNEKTEREGVGRNVDCDPMAALAWLANFLISMGQELKAGDVVTTGSTTQSVVGAAGQEVIANFDPLGQCSLIIR